MVKPSKGTTLKIYIKNAITLVSFEEIFMEYSNAENIAYFCDDKCPKLAGKCVYYTIQCNIVSIFWENLIQKTRV